LDIGMADVEETRRGPWIIKESREMYDNPWIRVTHHEVTTPTGKPGIYGLVAYKNRAIAVLPIADNGDTWLVGQYRFPFMEVQWELPMGGGPLDESPESAALRELREETGLRAETLTPLGQYCVSNCITDEVAYAFIATGLTEGETDFDDTEELEIKRVPFDEVLAMTMDGRITDLLSVTTVQRARLLGMA
jgi:ADP-ribose pyrophosphatase